MKTMHVEICCASLEDCQTAYRCGADAIELVSASLLGGLTPSMGLLCHVKERLPISVHAMVRPRGAGFCYSEEDFEVMCEDTRRFAEMGADGIVFGCLTPEGELDYERCAKLVECAGQCQTVFHRAIDLTGAHLHTAEKLINLGVTRILSSGGAQNAVDGVVVLRELQQCCGDRIQIMAGGGVRVENIATLVAATGITRLHLGGTSLRVDPSVHRNPAINFGASPPKENDSYPAVDEWIVSQAIRALQAH